MFRSGLIAAVAGLAIGWAAAPADAQTPTTPTTPGQSGAPSKSTGTTTPTAPGTGSPTTGGTTSGTGTGTTTGTSTSLALIKAELDEMNAFIEDLVDLFGVEVQTADEARQVVGFAAELYFIMKSRQAQGWPAAINAARGTGSSSTSGSGR